MALIGTIRKNGWILILTMVLALGGFILMDIVSNSQRYNTADANTIGKVNGKEIRSKDFEQYRDVIYSGSTGNDYQIRNQVWTQFVEDAIVREQAEAIGLGVSKDELKELHFGTNISPVIKERFRAANGDVDREQLSQIQGAITSGQLDDEKYRDFRTRWSIQEGEVEKQRLQDKMTAMITKGIYAPTWQAEQAFLENNQRVDYLYVRVPYDKVQDSEVSVTDADYSAFLKKNPKLYDQAEETRLINYVTFNVVPTADDTVASREKVVALIGGLKGKDDSLFVINNEGVYSTDYRSKSDLPAAVADQFLAAPFDSVVGPYMEDGSWVIAKILDRKVLPDSVKARHILIQGANAGSEKVLDSLKLVIESGQAKFEDVAKANSQDPGSGAKGGDLGYFANGRMVPEFNNICFNTGVQGKLYKVATQFGWHLIEITGKKIITNQTSVRAAYISEMIRPSTATQSAMKDKALEMISAAKTLAELEAKAAASNMQVEVSQALKDSDFSVGLLGTGKDARDVVKWAFGKDIKPGQVSKLPFAFVDQNGGYFDSKYAVVALRSISPKGAASVASLKSNPQVEIEVKNMKKAELIKSKLSGTSDLMAAANAYQMTVDTGVGATMLNVNVAKGGPEPRVIGTVFGLSGSAVSKPIAGTTGVYMVQRISEIPAVAPPAELTQFKRQVVSSAQSMVRLSLMNSLKKNADVKDNRNIFF